MQRSPFLALVLVNSIWGFPATAAPEPTNHCQRALAEAHSELRDVDRIEFLKMTLIQVSARYPDHPRDRPDGYEFFMVGPGGFEVLASTAITDSISSNIIANCPAVSLVAFSVYPEAYVTVGLIDGEIRVFECYEAYDTGQSSEPNPPWGFEGCL